MSSGHLRSVIEMRAEAVFLLPALSGVLWYETLEQTFLIATLTISVSSVYIHGILVKFQNKNADDSDIEARDLILYLPEGRILVSVVSVLVIFYPISLIWIGYGSFVLLNRGVENIYLFTFLGLLFLWILKLLIPVSESEELRSWKAKAAKMVDHDDGVLVGFQEVNDIENTDEQT